MEGCSPLSKLRTPLDLNPGLLKFAKIMAAGLPLGNSFATLGTGGAQADGFFF